MRKLRLERKSFRLKMTNNQKIWNASKNSPAKAPLNLLTLVRFANPPIQKSRSQTKQACSTKLFHSIWKTRWNVSFHRKLGFSSEKLFSVKNILSFKNNFIIESQEFYQKKQIFLLNRFECLLRFWNFYSILGKILFNLRKK